MPRAGGQLTPAAVERADAARRLARVLVVDDDAAVRDALAAVLADEGYRVALAADGREALAVLDRAGDPIGVILLDLMMPNGSGWHVLQSLASGRRRPPAVIVVTALDPAHVRLPAGAVDRVLRKPFAVEEVLAAVREHATRPAAPPDPATGG